MTNAWCLGVVLLAGCPQPRRPPPDVTREDASTFRVTSRSGRWVGTIRDHELVIDDRAWNRQFTLTHARLGGERLRPAATSLAFTPGDAHALYFRVSQRTTAIAIRDLETSEERIVELARGIPWAIFANDTSWTATVYAILDDTDHNGRLEFPDFWWCTSYRNDCVTQAIATSSWHVAGDRPRRGRLHLDTGNIVFESHPIEALRAGS